MNRQPEGDAAATWVATDKLTPWADNPRENDHAVPEVAKSIKRFGFASPIIARPVKGGGLEIVAGHTRHKAALSLGLDRVPVRVMDLDPADAKLLALADNRLGELADWTGGLEDILRGLDADGVDLDGLGWSAEELDALTAPPPIEPDGTEDDVPEVQKEVHSQTGEVYELGPHRLACGDCRDPEVVALLMAAGVPDLLLTDPPYGIGIVGSSGTAGNFPGTSAPRHQARPIIGDDAPFDPAHLLTMAPKIILWGGNHYASDVPSKPKWLVWDKKDGAFQGSSLGDCELAWTNLCGAARLLHHTWQGMYRKGEGERAPRVHPTQKPVDLMAWCMEQASLADDAVVLDTYAGSGSTLIACAMTGRRARLIELDPRYCDVIRRRWTRCAKKHGQDPGPGALE